MKKEISFICHEKEGGCGTQFSVTKEFNDAAELFAKVFCPSCGSKFDPPNHGPVGRDYSTVGFAGEPRAASSASSGANQAISEAARRAAADDLRQLNANDPEVQPGVRQSVVEELNRRADQWGIFQ